MHVHPVPTGIPGQFSVHVALPTDGDYIVNTEFVRANNPQGIMARDIISVGSAAQGRFR